MAPADELIPQGEHGAAPRRKQQAVDHRATRTGLGTPNPETSSADAVNAQNPTRAAASVIVPVLPVASSQADHDGQQQPPPAQTPPLTPQRAELTSAVSTPCVSTPEMTSASTPQRVELTSAVSTPCVSTPETAYIFTAGLALNMAKFQPVHPPPFMRV